MTTSVPDNLSFTMKKFALLALLERAATVVPNRDSQPVLRNFLVEAQDTRLRVAATDMELSIIAVGEMVQVLQPGRCVLPAAKMLNLLHEAEDGEVSVVLTDGKATIRIGRTRWVLRVAASAEYPALPEESEIKFTEVDRHVLVTALSRVKYAACRDALKPGFMMIDVSKGRMRAADGVRFQQCPAPSLPDFQVPVGAVDDLIKILRSTEAPTVSVGEDEYQLVFQIGSGSFIANRLSARFPDVDAVMLRPVELNDQELCCARSELVSAIRRVRVTADEETSAVRLSMGKDGLAVSSRDKYGSEASEIVDATWSHKQDRVAAFNWSHLLEMVQSVDDKSVSLKFGKDVPTRPSPVLIVDSASGAIGVLHQLRAEWV